MAWSVCPTFWLGHIRSVVWLVKNFFFFGTLNCSTFDISVHSRLCKLQETLQPLISVYPMCSGRYVGEIFFLVGVRVGFANWNPCLKTKNPKKQGIPHWCSYSSKKQYLSASIAGFLWCDKSIVLCVERQDFYLSYSKMHLWRKTEYLFHFLRGTFELRLCLEKCTY